MAIPKKTTKKKPVTRKKKPQPHKVYWRFLGVIFVLILLSPFYYGYVIKTFSSAWQWVRDLSGNPMYHTYKSFEINIPSQYSIHGIDVSYAQGKIDWTKVKAMREDSVHISFAFIKATEGLLKVDPYFKRNWREAPKNGIICGPYHFLRANKNGQWQARFFMQNVTVEKGDLPPVVDVETLDGVKPEQMRKELQAFVTFVEHKTKTKPIIYTGFSYYVDYLAGFFNGYTIWLADYDHPTLDEAKQVSWQFWQHSDKARVNGIYHTVDFDAFKGDSTSFQQLLIR